MGLLSDIQDALAARLETITVANGYLTEVKSVYFDKIPMATQLDPHQLPAILLLFNAVEVEKIVGCNRTKAIFEIQCIDVGESTDKDMINFTSDVYKAVFYNSSTDTALAFRDMNSAIYDIDSPGIEYDLNMIEANRFAMINLQIIFNSQFHNL